jgi:hypothetical protein
VVGLDLIFRCDFIVGNQLEIRVLVVLEELNQILVAFTEGLLWLVNEITVEDVILDAVEMLARNGLVSTVALHLLAVTIPIQGPEGDGLTVELPVEVDAIL